MVSETVGKIIVNHCCCFLATGLLVLLDACSSPPAIKETNTASTINSFNNDSAQKALLLEYSEEQKKTGNAVLDTNRPKIATDFSELFPVFADNCMPCHSKNGNAPFVLTSYEAIRKKSAVIKDVMLARLMPPWLADVKYSSLINAPRLTDSIRCRIINWIDEGSKPAKLPYNKEIKELMPDGNAGAYKTYFAKEHIINSNSDSYQCFVIDLNLKADTFVRGFRYHSSNTASIHHIMVYLDTAGVLNSSPDCWDCMKADVVNKLVPIDSWARGMLPYKLNGELAFRFPKGSKLLLQTHYGDEGNKGQKEQTRLDIYYTQHPQRQVAFEILNNLDIFFPANSIKTESLKFRSDSSLSLIGCVPHMHFLAKKIELFAITSENKKINILKINNWDYLWQGSYYFTHFINIPANSTIYMNAVFDNTVNNPGQPNHPVKDVKYNTYSNEEMMVLCLYTTPGKKGDNEKQPVQILR